MHRTPDRGDRPYDLSTRAVALRRDPATGDLPRIVASGRGAVAEQILQIAFARGVKVREDADLAEILSALEVDESIPIEAIAAVAEILSHIYLANSEEAAVDVAP